LLFLLRQEKPRDIIALLNRIYNIELEKEIDFLVYQLADNHRLPLVLAYYTNLRLKKFQKQDYWVLYMLAANGQYERTSQVALDCYLNDNGGDTRRLFATLAFSTAILSGKESLINSIYQHVPASLQKIADLYLGRSVILASEDIPPYLEILERVLLLAGPDSLTALIEAKRHFVVDITGYIGDLFYDIKNTIWL